MTDSSSTDIVTSTDMFTVPASDLELDVRGLRAYVAMAGEDLVLVVQENGSGGNGLAVTVERSISANLQDAINAAEQIAHAARYWADLLRVRAGDYRPLREPQSGQCCPVPS
jgi:hypothetical protein